MNSGGVLDKTLNTTRHEELIAFLIRKRAEAGMRQTELAEKIGEYQSWIARLESGQRRLDVIEFETLAQALVFSPSEFFGPPF